MAIEVKTLQFQGKVWKFGSNVDTDAIIPARYLVTTDPSTLALHCMAGIDPDFTHKCSRGDIIVAGWNFGCGSSREHAPIAIKAAGISCVIAKNFARIFYRNAFNMGLPIVEATEETIDAIQEGDLLLVNLGEGTVQNLTKGQNYHSMPVPEFMRTLLESGGLIPYVKKRYLAGEKH